jgi:hypothetical protein
MGVASLFLDFSCAIEGGREVAFDFSDARDRWLVAATLVATALAVRNLRREIIDPSRK